MKRTLAMLAAILLPFVAMSASYTNSFVRNGVTYVQRGGLTVKDYVVTNVTSSGSSNMTTNDVCNIVTNTVWGSWSFPDTLGSLKYAPSYDWLVENGDKDSGYYVVEDLHYYNNERWEISLAYYFYDDEWYADETSANDDYSPKNASSLVFQDGYTGAELVATRNDKNALDLARDKDLPQNTPVDELLFNGADGKVYHLRIGSRGSIDIYTEVTP